MSPVDAARMPTDPLRGVSAAPRRISQVAQVWAQNVRALIVQAGAATCRLLGSRKHREIDRFNTLFNAISFIWAVITIPWICTIQCVSIWQGCLCNHNPEYLTFAAPLEFKYITIALRKRIFLER
jgi:hypothetical protein